MARAILALLLFAAACAPRPVRADQVRMYDDPRRPEKEWGYEPRAIEVARGTTVTFTNAGVAFHSVTSDSAPRAFDAGANLGEKVTLTLERPGTWACHCGVHPDMKGVVHVRDGSCR
ncbi:MAG: hypothetical protein FJ028_05820 [Chloroflexi bacterium]|nr:hypothetical protein [Chloroflexota bacterium]